MKYPFAFLASVAVLGTVATAVPAVAQSENASPNASRNQRTAKASILKWHEVMLDVHSRSQTPGQVGAGQNGGPLRSTRGYAMTQIAVFDAINAFDGKYTSYNNIPDAERGAAVEVAIAYAAHDVMAGVWTGQAGILADVLADDLASINASPDALAKGRAVGEAAAAAMLARRVGDGSEIGEVQWGQGGVVATGTTTFFGQPVNGGQTDVLQWIPDPESATDGFRTLALGASWGAVTPFGLQNGAQFRASPFPTPGTAKYRSEYNDVKAIGSAPGTNGGTGNARTQFIGNFWGYEGTPQLGAPPRIYAQIAIELANRGRLNNPLELARYLALVHISMADAGITIWDSKYYYNIGRPVTVIRVEDGDSATQTDPTWTPFGLSQANRPADRTQRITPPFPAYSSGHAAFGSAIFESARGFMPNNTSFTFVSEEYNGTTTDPLLGNAPRPLVPVRYRSLSAAEQENGRSRVFNGVHWQIDSDTGIEQGQQVARYARSTLFQRR